LELLEAQLDSLYKKDLISFPLEEFKVEVCRLEKRKRKLLEEKEMASRLKSRALWLAKGDENNKYFYQYANHKEIIDKIIIIIITTTLYQKLREIMEI
jgi:hypothetical protein